MSDGQHTLDRLGLLLTVTGAESPAWLVVVAQQELRGRNSCPLNLWCITVVWNQVFKELYFYLHKGGKSVFKLLFNLAFS